MTDYKKLVDEYETYDKQELIERLTMSQAKLLTAEKEIDRLNEYVQEMERAEISKKL